tara:strand:+ start:12484 stop:13473 length:990 start_codon:yes stop_codon:yes gene_type:complete
MATNLQTEALKLLVGPPAIPAAAVAKRLGVNKATVSKWIRRWLDEGKIIQDPNAIEISSWITGGRPPKIYVAKYHGNKGSTPLETNMATKVPAVITSTDAVEPSMILDGNYARPHSGAWICRGVNKPKTDLSESRLCVKDNTINQVRNIRLDYTDGWRVNYKEGPRKRSVIIYPPSKEMTTLTTLDDFIVDREKKMMNIWNDIVRSFGFDYKFLDQMVPMEIGVPVSDEGLSREAGQRIKTVDGDMWVDRSEEAVVPGAVELEGDAPVMRGLAKMPDLLHEIILELGKGRKEMGENTNERLERLENAMTKLLDGVDEPEDDDKEVEGYV